MKKTNGGTIHGSGKTSTGKARVIPLQNFFKPKPSITEEELERLKTYNINTVEVTQSEVNRTILQVGMLLQEQLWAMHKKIAEVVPDLAENYILQEYRHQFQPLDGGDGSVNRYQRIIHKRQEALEAGQGPTLEQVVALMGDKIMMRDETGWYLRAHIHLGIPAEALGRIPITPTDAPIDQPEPLVVPVVDESPLPEEVPVAGAE